MPWADASWICLRNTLNISTSIQWDAKHTKIRHSIEYYCSAGILTCCPSTTPFSLALGPTNPGTINVAQETLDLRCVRISLTLWLLMPTFSLLCAPRRVAPYASVHKERSPTDYRFHRELNKFCWELNLTSMITGWAFLFLACNEVSLSRSLHPNKRLPVIINDFKENFLCETYNPISSVLCLAPLNYRREVSGLVSCYALFEGWLLLSQPPRCLRNFTSFTT